MKVHLRERKLKNGRIRLYLDFYKGYINKDGKSSAIRDYEYLDLYLYEKANDFNKKRHNKEILQLANSIKAKRELDIQSGKYGLNNRSKSKANFIDYFNKLTEDRFRSSGNYGNWKSTLKHLSRYTSGKVRFSDIDEQFCEKFKNYLINKPLKKNGEYLSTSSISSYFNKFRASLKKAVRERIISFNPSTDIKLPKIIEKDRQYLTLEELKSLYKAECRYPVLKRAFLFSCLTGLRFGDIEKLSWKQIQTFNNGIKIHHYQEKTKSLEYLDINHQAIEYIGDRKDDSTLVFEGLKYSDYYNVALLQWVLRAGITKHITFHCGRHTYATLLITYDVDLFTVSKLLGHQDIKTTQIYAKIIDKKKREAVDKLPQIKL
ncbi:MAG: site-specific integrase [Flavobacteriales bacterium]|nr:site-specific integrase [Flavobacteriales bacterium]